MILPIMRVNPEDKYSLYQFEMFLMFENMEHEREIYGLLDLMGDLGGVTEIVMLMFGFILSPIAEHKFNLQAAKRLFIAQSKDGELFVEPNEHDGNKNKYLEESNYPDSLNK